jgi:lambda family phage tail tape measure protein
MIAGSLSVKLGLVTAQFSTDTDAAIAKAAKLKHAFEHLTEGTKELTEKFKAFGGGAALGIFAIEQLVEKSVEMAAKNTEMAESFGLTTGQMLTLTNAIQTSGVKSEAAGRMITTLYTKIDELKNGSKEAHGKFAELHLSFEELANAKPYEAFVKVTDSLAHMEDAAQRVSSQKWIFGGRGALGLNVEHLAHVLHEGTGEFDGYAESLEKLTTFHNNLKTSMMNLELAFAKTFSGLFSRGKISADAFAVALRGIASYMILAELAKLVSMINALSKALAGAEAASLILSGGVAGIAKLAAMAVALAGAWWGVSKAIEHTAEEQDALSGEELQKKIDKLKAAIALEDKMSKSSGGYETVGMKERKEQLAQLLEQQKQLNAEHEKEALQVDLVKQAYDAELASLQAVIDYQKASAQLDLDSIHGNKTSIELKKVDLKLAQDLANAKAAAAQDMLGKTPEEQGQILEKAKLKEQALNDKAKQDKELLLAMDQNALDIQEKQNNAARSALGFTHDMNELKLRSATMDEYAAQQAEAKLNYDTKIQQLVDDYLMAMDKANMKDTDRLKLAQDLENNISKANEERDADTKQIAQNEERALAALTRQIDAQKQNHAIAMARANLALKQPEMNPYQLKQAEMLIDKNAKMADIDQKRKEIMDTMGDGATRQKMLDQLDQEKTATEDLYQLDLKLAAQQEARRTSFAAGWTDGWKDMVQTATDDQQYGKDMFNAVMGDMSSSIDEFVTKGKFSWNSFRDSVIQDITKMMLKMALMKLLQSAIGMFHGGGGGADPTAALMSGDTPESFDLGIGVPHDAGGGYLDRPTLVGENGPELFIPNRTGQVIPNQQMGSMMQQQPQNIFNGPYIASMNAIDTQSATQFLAKNKNAVMAANQSAMRGLPASR